MYEVPNLTGKFYYQLEDIDNYERFKFSIKGKEYSDKFERGMICAQTVAEGTAVQKDLWEAPERFNELGKLIMTESDVAKRNEYYAEMMAIWDDEIPGTILYCPDMIWAVRNGLEWDYNPGKAVNFRADHLRVVG